MPQTPNTPIKKIPDDQECHLLLDPELEIPYGEDPTKENKPSIDYYVDQSLNSRLFIILMMALVLSQTGQELIYPFLPVKIEQKGISNYATAYIIASYNVAAIVGSFYTDSIQSKIGRRNSILLGMLSEGTGYILLGFGAYIDYKPTYIGLSIIARII